MSGEQTDPATMPDLSNEVPDLKPYLRSGEKVILIEHVKTPSFPTLPDYREELAKLCGVDKPEDIGKNGPPMAARTAQKSAGQGLFECRFGRDGLYAALDFLDEFPALTRTVLLDYATLIGMSDSIEREEEFGRMFHEARDPEKDPVAQDISKKHGWGWPFYGSVDATPLFVKVLCAYVATSNESVAFLDLTYKGRDGNVHTMWDALAFSMNWIVSRMHRNKLRFLEYRRAFPESISNQVMEDSWDSHFHQSGQLANETNWICSTEVQGLVYDALISSAKLMMRFEETQCDGNYYRLLADELYHSARRTLWIDSDHGGYFAVGTDRDEKTGQHRVMKIMKGIPFFLLNSKIFTDKANPVDKIRVEQSIQTLFSKQLLCAAGIRSLALNQPRFMPGAYHNGNCWIMQTFQIAEGLREQGYFALAAELDRRIIAVVEQTRLYPEFVNGGTDKNIRLNERIVDTYDSIDKRKNRREQPPQQIQLWTLTAYGAIQYRRRMSRTTFTPQPFEEQILSNLPS